VAQLLHAQPEYGPSVAAFTAWKHCGVPTREWRQGEAFGRKTQLLPPPAAGKALSHAGRQMRHSTRNPISWEGCEPLAPPPLEEKRSEGNPRESNPRESNPREGNPREGKARERLSVSQRWAEAQSPPPPKLEEEQMQQTWAELLRNGSVRPSAAMALVDQSFLPKEFSSELMGEPKPKSTPIGGSVNLIGLSSSHNLRDNRVSSRFTSQFNPDPYIM